MLYYLGNNNKKKKVCKRSVEIRPSEACQQQRDRFFPQYFPSAVDGICGYRTQGYMQRAHHLIYQVCTPTFSYTLLACANRSLAPITSALKASDHFHV